MGLNADDMTTRLRAELPGALRGGRVELRKPDRARGRAAVLSGDHGKRHGGAARASGAGTDDRLGVRNAAGDIVADGAGLAEAEPRLAGQLLLGPFELTNASCGRGSLHDVIVKQLPNVRSYVVKDDRLVLVLAADSGARVFEPATLGKISVP